MEQWCIQQGRSLGATVTDRISRPTFACKIVKEANWKTCLDCRHFFSARQRHVTERGRHPAGVVIDRDGAEAGVADLYRGAGVFLVLGGASVVELPLGLLKARGIATMSVNNCPAVLPPLMKPTIWLHTDKACKFHTSIWMDPAILKIIPTAEKGRKLHRRRDGVFEELDVTPADMPGTLFFNRNTTFNPDTWLYEPTINRGNSKKDAAKNRLPHTINTMFAALRLAFYLGFHRVYLVGCDFKMQPWQPYGFRQAKHSGGVDSNNNAYKNMQLMFDMLAPRFAEVGFEVYNVTPGSDLKTFPFMRIRDAVNRETLDIDQELDTDGWYEHTDREGNDGCSGSDAA